MFTISLTRVDTYTFGIRMILSDESEYKFTDADDLTLTVRRNANSSRILIEKKPVLDDGLAVFTIDPQDTQELKFGVYKYDVQLIQSDGTVTTIIKYSDFNVTEEVTL
jgi:hypothetical protein